MIDSVLIIILAKTELEQGRPEEALKILDNLIVANNGEAIFLKGEIYFKLQKWGESLNQFSLFLEQFPDDTKAKSYCAMIHNILGFYHKDLYNP
jgi:tetratricopeptide (TPR) repeat protein